MSKAIAICSMLHESPAGSASQQFRGRPVLRWTIDRVSQAKKLNDLAIVCWDDQQTIVRAAVGETRVVSHGNRSLSAMMQAIAAARRWSDGWRGGLLQTCDFDAGFDAVSTINILAQSDGDLAVLIDPSAALVDPSILDALVQRAEEKPDEQIFFAPAASGLSAVALRRSLIERLAVVNIHPGKLLNYLPDQPSRDPISGEGCIDLPIAVKRSTQSFRMDSDRQINRLTNAMESLNGQLRTADAETIVAMQGKSDALDQLPREIVLELNTDRRSHAKFRPSAVHRPPMTIATATTLLDHLCESPDIRLTIAGVGDPLEADLLFDVIDMAQARGIRAIHVETDLLSDEAHAERLARSAVDVVTVHLPAMTGPVYQRMMGIDALQLVMMNIAAFLRARLARSAGVPILVPTFTKCRENLGEMEGWYDQWIRAVGCAVIVGANDFAGQIVDVSVANMMPPRRRACRRIQSRMSVLSDGTVVACEQDILGRRPMGRVGEQSLKDIWMRAMSPLRAAHGRDEWDAEHPLCGTCAEWNRP